jgi:hypothetical protein
MSGISEIQKRRVFEEITRLFFVSGENPRLIDIQTEISNYFSKNPVGLPLSLPLNFVGSGLRSDVDKFNEVLANMSMNMDVLYESAASQVDEVMLLTTLLRSQLERLGSRRKRLESQIDDYLFSLYNTDGYYYSASDTFADTTLVDLNLTSAFIDTVLGSVTLPTISSLTTRMSPTRIIGTSITVTANSIPVTYTTNSPFSGALDNLTNTAWAIEISRPEPTEVICVVELTVGTVGDPSRISRIEFDPFGISPVQTSIEGIISTDSSSNVFDFGNKIQTSANKMAFVDSPRDLQKIRITLRKTQPDYNTNENNVIKYQYIFGAKDIAISQHVYDSESIFVSVPLSLPEDLSSDNVIDAVSLVVEDNIPADTKITYYVAADVSNENPTISDFSWRQIEPLSNNSNPATPIVKFDGALNFTRFIRPVPGASDLQLTPIDRDNPDHSLINPSPYIVPGLDIYRIAGFEEEVLPSSLLLEEGINSTRILHVDFDEDAVDSLSFWTNYVNGTTEASQVYGSIDVGNEFFYGGDVGDSGRSVYIETYLDSITDQELILKEIHKLDPNSKQWDMRIYLNGREIGNLPVGTDKLVLPWKFQQGLNHVCVLINIPEATEEYPHPYIGTIDLMGDSDLFEFGSVKLGTWQYVDLFHLKYNEVGQPQTFTIYNNEIISRREPTTNFRLRYSKSTDGSPNAIRVRADLSRSALNQHVAPSIDACRLRFLYGEKE